MPHHAPDLRTLAHAARIVTHATTWPGLDPAEWDKPASRYVLHYWAMHVLAIEVTH